MTDLQTEGKKKGKRIAQAALAETENMTPFEMTEYLQAFVEELAAEISRAGVVLELEGYEP